MHLSDGEWRVMGEVWKLPEATARQVHTALESDTGWAYSTVKTMMARLVEKGALRVARKGKQSVFTAAISRDEAREQATKSLVERVFEGAAGGLFQHLLGRHKLSRKDRDAIRHLLDEQESKPGGRRG